MFVLVPARSIGVGQDQARLIPRPRPRRRGDVRPIRFRRANAFLRWGRNQLPALSMDVIHPGGRISLIMDRSLARKD